MSEQNIPLKTSAFTLMTVAAIVTLCALYMMSQFLRNSVGVIAPDLARDIQLSAAELGLLSSVFFLVFGLAQIPLGIALDRFGAKPCVIFSAGIAVTGCVVFAAARSGSGLVVGRILMGLGSASFLMAPLALYARWFAPSQFSTIAGIQLGVGTFGAIFATAPLAFATAAIGWRATFLTIAVATFAIGLFVWLIVRDDGPVRSDLRARPNLRDDFAGLWQVITTPTIGRLFFLQLCNYPTYLLIVGLWGGPYLAHVYGLELAGRGEILFVPALAQVIGSVFWGPMDRVFGRYKPPILIAATSVLFSLGLLTLLGDPPIPILVALLAVLGFCTGTVSLILAQGKALLPTHLLGRAFTLLNIGAMGGGFLVQFVSGAVIDLFSAPAGIYPLAAYRLVFGLQAAFLATAILLYLGSRDRPAPGKE